MDSLGQGAAERAGLPERSLGFWAALREVPSAARERRCGLHKIGHALSALPDSARPGAKRALAQVTGFRRDLGTPVFPAHPAERRARPHATGLIDSTFVTVRHRTRGAKRQRAWPRRCGTSMPRRPPRVPRRAADPGSHR
ncbi:MAG: hypothetical protein HKP61_08645 [Dactylosporangium sp.]|nr:hypothetical protein [Dactylosporangium sp.]NNJ61003.1 hypothetical protein [Dactylosporangium sp.]